MKVLCEKHTIREVKNRLIQIRAMLFIDPFIQKDIPEDKRICSAPMCKIVAKFIIRHHGDEQSVKLIDSSKEGNKDSTN